ncbi:MAG: hypothetical protein NTX66_00400 [Candidatus Falkowbacteria bacterium]|nr:hypothetical protein [Candidatus Falkowbacteria bacterium]
MKIKPYFRTKLSEPFQGKYYHEAGASVALTSAIETKSLGKFMVIIPDPVSLNFNNAVNFIERSKQIKQEIDNNKKMTVFSGKLNEKDIKGLNLNQIKELDKDADIFRDLENDKIFDYIQTTMGVVVSLVTAVESFLNMIIPFDYTVEITRQGEKKIIEKNEIVRRFSIEDKIELVEKCKGKTGIKQQKFWNSFKIVKELRDNIIHFKKTDSNLNQLWSPIIVLLFDIDFDKTFVDFVDLVNYLEPAYLEEDKS